MRTLRQTMQSESGRLLAFWAKMHDRMLQTLQGLRPAVLSRWEELLRAAPVTTPLANPDALVYLMDWTLDRFFDALRGPLSRRRLKARHAPKVDCSEKRQPCACGMNPLLAYFSTAEQALIQAALPVLQPRERESVLSSVVLALQLVARREIGTFCAVCQKRHAPEPPSTSSKIASIG